jgi:hypothetical protein
VAFGGNSSPACLKEVEGRGRQAATRALTRSQMIGKQHRGAVQSDRQTRGMLSTGSHVTRGGSERSFGHCPRFGCTSTLCIVAIGDGGMP